MKEFTLKASSDNLDLAVALFEPEGSPKGFIQFVHGMCEHKERYFATMEWLAGNGYACIIHDNRGHGASVKSPEDLGYMYEGGWSAMVDDAKIVTDWAKTNFPGLRYTLFGHSMGSLIVRSYAKRYDDAIDQLFVCGCPSDNPLKGVGKFLAGSIGVVRGDHYRSDMLQGMTLGSYNKKFEKQPNAWVCSDKDCRAKYNDDPLCQFIFTANGFQNLLGLMQDCYSLKGWKMANPGLPVHFISGAEDPCRLSDKALQQAVDKMKKAGYANTDLKTYPGMRHEILNETEKHIVREDLLKYL